MSETTTLTMSHHLKPRCPRDNHIMRYEPTGVRWKGVSGEDQSLPSYHCPYMGCSVRYDPSNGYYTVIHEPDSPYFVDEPATNLALCPLHGTWLHREMENVAGHFVLRCGIEGCGFARSDVGGIWLRE